MVFSDTTYEQGLVQDARYIVGANTSSYPIKDITRNINRWYDKAVTLIFKSAGRWQWDDSNHGDLSSATASLVSGQQDYQLDVAHLKIDRVEIKNEDGIWVRLLPFDKRDVSGSIEEFQKTNSVPQFYDVVGDSLFLYPAPDYSQSASLRVYFQRGANYFQVTDTSKEAGFASQFHRYLSLGAAYDFALKENLSNRNVLREEISAMETEIADFYALRQPDEHIRLTVKKVNYK